jgi:branched-chain amino acid transport system ATP-binding protein
MSPSTSSPTMGLAAESPAPPILQLHEVQMRFGGVTALDGVSCDVSPGIIHAVIGPNGAGKTTLFNCISGVLRPTGGAILVDGRRVDALPPHRVAQMGISRTFQHVALFAHMTVLENVMLGRHIRSRSGFWATGLRFPGMRREERRIREQALTFLDLVGLADSAPRVAGTLPLGKQKVLEIARALATEPRLLLLDEPAGGLNMKETEELGELIQRVRELGATVLLVEHDMNLVMDISDRILVLHYGRRLALGTPAEIKDDAAVIEAYLGEA